MRIHVVCCATLRSRAFREYLGVTGVWRMGGNKMCLALSIHLLILITLHCGHEPCVRTSIASPRSACVFCHTYIARVRQVSARQALLATKALRVRTLRALSSTAGKNPCVRQSIAGKGSVRISRALRAHGSAYDSPLTMAASVCTVGGTEPGVRSSSAGRKSPARAQTLRAKALRATQKTPLKITRGGISRSPLRRKDC